MIALQAYWREKRWDGLGLSLAGLCLVHCLATSIMLALLASAGGFLLSPIIHEAGLGLAIVFGAFDYTMTQTKNAEYLAAFTPEQRTYFESFPTWMEAAWALGIWGALAGSALLLLRGGVLRHGDSALPDARL